MPEWTASLLQVQLHVICKKLREIFYHVGLDELSKKHKVSPLAIHVSEYPSLPGLCILGIKARHPILDCIYTECMPDDDTDDTVE